MMPPARLLHMTKLPTIRNLTDRGA